MQDGIAVIGAGVIGCAVAQALAREGHRVTLIDRADPGTGGASYGNVGHLAAELVQPLPSRQLLFGFWRELFAFGGPLDIPLRRFGPFAPWALRFAHAAFRREINTRYLAPLVKPASSEFERLFRELGRQDLVRRNGHYQVWFGPKAQRRADEEANEMTRLGIPTIRAPREILDAVAFSAGKPLVSGLLFPDSGHVIDPLEIVLALTDAAVRYGARVERTEVRTLRTLGSRIELQTESGRQTFDGAVICTGAWSRPLLASFDLHAPLEAAYGYHVDLAQHPAHVNAPLIYMDEKVLVTPMAGRLRGSTYMEFTGLDSAPDPRKPARLRAKLQALGYGCESEGPSWRGPRPVLPDYLPGIGRVPGPHRLYYAIGHQHLGLTLAPVTAEIIADLVSGRDSRHDIAPFDLRRFGRIPNNLSNTVATSREMP
jgi:D-hydroxyproline dehydrogenase